MYTVLQKDGKWFRSPPVLSTPDTHILEFSKTPLVHPSSPHSDEELRITYDIDRTLKEIRQSRWQRIALQFPDEMLPDAPRVFQLLSRGLADGGRVMPIKYDSDYQNNAGAESPRNGLGEKEVQETAKPVGKILVTQDLCKEKKAPRLYILADTSYGACCVDEVAAEHVDADVVVHYGRACLSPTVRLPVIHVFTHQPLDLDPVISLFKETYPDRDSRIIVVADVIFSEHVDMITSTLMQKEGYTNLFATTVVHDPSSPIPNRTIPKSVRENPEKLRNWQLFHISDPPSALLLSLSSRVAAIHIYPTVQGSNTPVVGARPLLASTAAALRRRYAILTSLSTVPIFGILINTLSVKNYLPMAEHVKKQIAAAGKKSYTFVVGKLNAAKVANFSEIGGWVVIGCWESSLVDSKDFWKPVITPYELELALRGDMERVWTGEWHSDYQTILDAAEVCQYDRGDISTDPSADIGAPPSDEAINEDQLSEPESAPPEFDLRTGRYISSSSSRPMQTRSSSIPTETITLKRVIGSTALTKRENGDLATVGGTLSPGAEFLRSQRTWRGLGSDFAIQYEVDGVEGQGSPAAVFEGRSGIARGYAVGDDIERH